MKSFLIFVALLFAGFAWSEATAEKAVEPVAQPPVRPQVQPQLQPQLQPDPRTADIAYCLDGQWTQPERTAVAAGFAAWLPAGVSFHEARAGEPCETRVVWGTANDQAFGGQGSVGLGWIKLSRYWMDRGCSIEQVVRHEAGHNLGLLDTVAAGGVMDNEDCFNPLPTADELAAVAAIWRTK